MGNQACGGNDRKTPKSLQEEQGGQRLKEPINIPPQKSNVTAPLNPTQPQARTEGIRGQAAAYAGEGVRAPPIAQNRDGNISTSKSFDRHEQAQLRQEYRGSRNGTDQGGNSAAVKGAGQSNLSLSHWAALQNEASSLLMQDKNIESLAKFKEALRVQIAVIGERHPDIALTMNNLGIVSRACGQAEESVSYFRQALEICNEVFSPT
jgi:tetratricopeptide (TPR) repeat protein